MKRWLAALTTVALLAALPACGSQQKPASGSGGEKLVVFVLPARILAV